MRNISLNVGMLSLKNRATIFQVLTKRNINAKRKLSWNLHFVLKHEIQIFDLILKNNEATKKTTNVWRKIKIRILIHYKLPKNTWKNLKQYYKYQRFTVFFVFFFFFLKNSPLDTKDKKLNLLRITWIKRNVFVKKEKVYKQEEWG